MAIVLGSHAKADNGLTRHYFLITIKVTSVTQAAPHCKEMHPWHMRKQLFGGAPGHETRHHTF